MFGVFRSEPFRDDHLGELRRSGRYWKGSLALPACGTFRLWLAGTREAPAAPAVEMARELPARFAAMTPEIERGLFEHYEPYEEADDAGAVTAGPSLRVAGAHEVWRHVTPAHVLIESVRATLRMEIAFRTDWDVEHTVAGIFEDWRFVELNGSVMPRR